MAVLSIATIHVWAQQQNTGAVRIRPHIPVGDSLASTRGDSLRMARGDSLVMPRDTSRFKKTRAVDLDNTVKFKSKDSVVLIGRNDLRFYGDSEVDYDDIKLTVHFF